MNKKIIILVVVMVIITTAGFVWWRWMPISTPKYTGPVEKATMGVYQGEFSSLVFIAEKQGYFKDNGLDVTLTEFDSGHFPTGELIKGKFDFSVAAEYVAVSFIFDNKNLRILSTIDLPDAIEVIAKKDSGISSPQDLKGKKVGLQAGSVAEFLFGEFLTFNNMKYSDAKVMGYSQVSDFKDKFIKGDLDAVVVWNPFADEFKKELGENAISWNAQVNHPFYFLAFTRSDVIEKKPEMVRRFMQSLVDAEEYAEQNNKEAWAIIKDSRGYTDSYVSQVKEKNKLTVQLPQDLILTMEDEARWAIQNNLTKATEVPNYLDYIYLDALEKVKPEAVTIIH